MWKMKTNFRNQGLKCNYFWHNCCLSKNYEYNEDAAFLCPICSKDIVSKEHNEMEDDFEEEKQHKTFNNEEGEVTGKHKTENNI